MAYPAGVTVVTLTLGTTLQADGEPGVFSGTVMPIFGGTVRSILWAADGTAYTDSDGAVASGPSGVAAVAVPDPHQAGWVVPIQGVGGVTEYAPITDWGYLVSGVIAFPSGRRVIRKAFKVAPGQTSIDVDMVADGQLVAAVQGPYVPGAGTVDLTGVVRSVLVTTGTEARPSADVVIWVSPNSITPVNAAATDLVATPTGTADASAPTVPTGLTVTGQTTTTLDVSWGASTDNVGVTGYEVRINSGTGITKAVSPRTHQFTGLTPATTYPVQVRARDAAGNWSAWCTAVNGTTAATSDTTAPSAPTGLAASAITSSGFTLSWTASTDNVAVTGYEVEIGGSSYSTPTGTSAVITGRAASTNYSARVRARDAAGNWSTWTSLSGGVTTSASGPTQLFTDDFNRSNGAAGNGWQGPSGDGSNTAIVSNALSFANWSAYNRGAWQGGLPRNVSVRALFVAAAATYQGIFLGYNATTGGGVKLFNNGGTWVVGNADGFGTENTAVTGSVPAGSTALRLDLFADGTVRAYAGVGTASTLILDSTITALGITGLSSDTGSVYRAGYCGEAKTPNMDSFEIWSTV